MQNLVSAEPEYSEGQMRDRRKSALGRAGRVEFLLIAGVLLALLSVFIGSILWRAFT